MRVLSMVFFFEALDHGKSSPCLCACWEVEITEPFLIMTIYHDGKAGDLKCVCVWEFRSMVESTREGRMRIGMLAPKSVFWHLKFCTFHFVIFLWSWRFHFPWLFDHEDFSIVKIYHDGKAAIWQTQNACLDIKINKEKEESEIWPEKSRKANNTAGNLGIQRFALNALI